MKEGTLTRRFGWGIVILVLLFVLYYAGFTWMANRQEEDVNRAWAKVLFDPGSLPERYPPQETNETAEMLERDVAAEGNPFQLTGVTRIPPWSNGWKILDDVLAEPADRIDLPLDVKQYLSSHESDFAAIYRQVHDERPRWEHDIRFSHISFPDLMALRALTTLIATDALGKAQDGRSRDAIGAFGAAWEIVGALRNRPEEICQLTAMSLDRILGMTLRKMSRVPAEWQARVVEHDYRDHIKVSILLGRWEICQIANRSSDLMANRNSVLSGALVTKLGRPYFRLCALDASAAVSRELAQRDRDVCALDSRRKQNPADSLSWWNWYAGPSMVDREQEDRACAATMLLLEATQKVLRVKAVVESDPRTLLPASVEGLESSLCSDARWIYRPGRNRTFSLKFSKDLQWLKDRRLALVENPTEITWQLDTGAKALAPEQNSRHIGSNP
jgi:hypothetical protein